MLSPPMSYGGGVCTAEDDVGEASFCNPVLLVKRHTGAKKFKAKDKKGGKS